LHGAGTLAAPGLLLDGSLPLDWFWLSTLFASAPPGPQVAVVSFIIFLALVCLDLRDIDCLIT